MLNREAAKELEQLARANGGLLKREAVVARAKSPKSALHRFFEWDTKRAQEKLHLLIASQLIRAYEVYVEVKEGAKPEKVRAFVSLTTDRKSGAGYRLIADVLTDEERTEQMLQDALAELDAFKRKYRTLSALRPVFEAIEKARASQRPRAARGELRATA